MADQLTSNSTSRLLVPGCSYFIIFRASISELLRVSTTFRARLCRLYAQFLNSIFCSMLLVIQPSAYLFTPRYAANNGKLETLRLSRKYVEHGPAELDQARLERKIHLLSFASLNLHASGMTCPTQRSRQYFILN
ncbi:uncharacterized protein HD556DRAFT_417218 [Suillus plorans]|uniref:Uncharacterized protein n=1 Tax=Suillus plorans TaxID=116603 RepID=A0A9P7AQU8_9AGAM|nr:uncharacterized protein HD556DRAFT_417218 [Suillus plorans]KAG1794589.1 hypothetical protein HD556DRAFT_417218 [Suillus plorans]